MRTRRGVPLEEGAREGVRHDRPPRPPRPWPLQGAPKEKCLAQAPDYHALPEPAFPKHHLQGAHKAGFITPDRRGN